MSKDHPDRRRGAVSAVLLCAILATAAGLRLVRLDRVPPALSADEASNAYDGYCLLKTGRDRWGEPWPVVLRAFGDADYRPALMAYLTVPFQAVLGPGAVVTASRLPTAILGLATVLCLYLWARRVFGEKVALASALLLALNPWHVVMSRLAHESGLTPLFGVLILMLLDRAGVPFRGGNAQAVRLRWHWMAAAGAAAGLSAYSYASTKLFIPALLLAAAVIYRRELLRLIAERRRRWALAAMPLAAIVVGAPMIKVHITDWDRVNARALTESLFHSQPTVGTALVKIAGQYVQHFGPDWLFITGHPFADLSPPGSGQLHWYTAPLLVVGLAAMARQWRRNRAFALVLAWLLLYPIASATTKGGVGAAAPRAACGLVIFSLIGGIGLAGTLEWIRSPRARAVLVIIAVATIGATGGRFAYRYFAAYAHDPAVHAWYQAEFREAMDYLRPRRDLFDHVFISATRDESPPHLWLTSEAYIYPAVYLPIGPENFHAMRRIEINPAGRAGFHEIALLGHFTFRIEPDALDQYAHAFPTARVLLMARPGEVQGGRVVHEVYRPGPTAGDSGPVCLQLIAFDLAREKPRLTGNGR